MLGFTLDMSQIETASQIVADRARKNLPDLAGVPSPSYVQFSVAEPLTAGALLPFLRLLGAVAVMVTLPGAKQVAFPLTAIVASVVSELVQVRPLLDVKATVVLLLSAPVAAKAACPCELLEAVAELGLTEMLSSLGLLLPQAMLVRATSRQRKKTL